MSVSGFSARRIYLIARRDFIGYVKTLGFWITVLSPFLGLGFGLLASTMSLKSSPARYVSILDETGRYDGRIEAEIIARQEWMGEAVLQQTSRFTLDAKQRTALDGAIKAGGLTAGKAYLAEQGKSLPQSFKLPESEVVLVALPAPNLDALMPYIKGEQSIIVDGHAQKLSGLLQFFDGPDGAQAKYWTINPSAEGLSQFANRVLRDDVVGEYFSGSPLSYDNYRQARDAAPKTQKLNPLKTAGEGGDGQAITMIDKIPLLVAAGFSAFLWLTIFSGSYMLLMSMVEEKINKALEMLLASTRFTEILMGKLLGVAALTIASMAPWIIMGAVGLIGFILYGDAAIASALTDAISMKLISFFVVFFILGYIFYGSLFMALGSLAESMQDTQTLVTPIVILLTLCMMVVPIGIQTPDSALVRLASFIPF